MLRDQIKELQADVLRRMLGRDKKRLQNWSEIPQKMKPHGRKWLDGRNGLHWKRVCVCTGVLISP